MERLSALMFRCCTNSGVNMNSSGSRFTRVSQAIRNGNFELHEILHNKGLDLNARGPDGLCPLHVAAQAGKESVVIYLLSHGVDIDASSTLNETALYFAAREGHLDVVKCLLQFGPDVNNEGNKKAVYAAVYPGRTKTLQPVNHDNNTTRHDPAALRYETVIRKWLYKRLNNEKKWIFEALLGYGFVYEIAKGCEPKFFHGVVEIGLTGIVEDLLKYGADANMELDGETPLLVAIKTNQPDITDLLLLHGADFNARDEFGKTPMYYAAKTGNLKLVKSLLTKGANLSDYREIVHAVIAGNSPETLEELLNLGTIDISDCTIQGVTALGASLHRNNNADLIELLLDKGANVNERSGPDHITPLHYLSHNGDHRNCETILKNGAKVRCKNKYGRTPLHEASTSEIVKLLLEYGADINARDNMGRSPLHIASGVVPGTVLIDLLQAGADVDARDKNRQTPLHLAFRSRQIRKVRLLLNNGADINMRDNRNSIPGLYLINQSIQLRIDNIAMTLFISHTARLQACNLYVSEEILQCMRKTGKAGQLIERRLRDERGRCDEEIRKLQAKKIPHSNISFYGCLTKNISSLANSLNNEHIVQGLESDDVSSKEFPAYALMLKTKFRKAKERKLIIDQCYEFFGFVSGELAQFPAYCSEAIMHFLSNKDLQMLIAAWNATSQYPTETESTTWGAETLSNCSADCFIFESLSDDEAHRVFDACDDFFRF